MTPLQLCILVSSLAAILGTTSRTRNSRLLGCWVGLLSQPLWLHETWQAGQHGMFALSCIYVVMWSRGIYANRRPLIGADPAAPPGAPPGAQTSVCASPPNHPAEDLIPCVYCGRLIARMGARWGWVRHDKAIGPCCGQPCWNAAASAWASDHPQEIATAPTLIRGAF